MQNGAFSYPNISAPTTGQQIAQIRSYLYQLTDELNFAVPQAKAEEKKEAGDKIVRADDFQVNDLTLLPVPLPDNAFTPITTYASDHDVSMQYIPAYKMVLFRMYIKLGDAAIDAQKAFNVGTIAEEYRPPQWYALNAYTAKIANAAVRSSDGAIRMELQNSVAAGDNYATYITGFWFI